MFLVKYKWLVMLQDGHEICFVDDESFCQLSEVDPEAQSLLDRYIEKDEKRKKSTPS